MAIAVVAIHTHLLENCKNDIIIKIYSSIVELAVPFFFLTSGFLLSAKMSFSFNKKNDIIRTKKQTKKIVKMYILWTLIYLPLAVYHLLSSETSPVRATLIYIKGFIFVGEQYNSWPLWYLLSTIYAFAIIAPPINS
jgi:peptidoglycan/LPS O-acetylase OafA/YrhL